MGDIGAIAYELYGEDTTRGRPRPPGRGWHTAARRIWGERSPQQLDRILLRPHLALPHVISVVLGLGLFVLGPAGVFGPI